MIIIKIKALTTLVDRLPQSVGWENDPDRGLKTVSFNPRYPVILANSASSDLGLVPVHVLKITFVYTTLTS